MAYYDIVGSLPLELLILVVEYLDLEDIVRCQGVSRRWRVIFSCNTIITPFLRETLEFLGLDEDGVDIGSAIADAMSYFRWRLGLEHARPVKKIFLSWPKHMPRLPCPIRYHSRQLCYRNTNPHRKFVETLNLETGERKIWGGNETDKPTYYSPFLSDRYLVRFSIEMGTNYHLTAWDLHTGKKFSQRIPPFNVPHQIVDDKVVITGCPVQAFGRPSHVYVWDLSSNHIQEIGSFVSLQLWHVDAIENMFVAFEVNWKSWRKQLPKVQQTKWETKTGQLLDKKIFDLPLPAETPRLGHTQYGGFHPYYTFGHKTATQIFLYDDWPATKLPATMHLEYDYAADRLSVRKVRDCFNNYSSSAYLLPNLVYRSSTKTGRCQVSVFNATTGEVTLHSVQSSTSLNSFPQQKWGAASGNPLEVVFGDREVFGWANDTGVQLWFFNPRFVPDGIPDCDCENCRYSKEIGYCDNLSGP